MRRVVAPALIALGALIIQPIAAAASETAPISDRFATYTKITPPTGGAQVQINATLPPGFPTAEIRARVASGGTLAATGAPAWPLWAGVLALVGAGIVTAGYQKRRQHG